MLIADGQRCTDSVDIQQDGHDELNPSRLAIVPRLSFVCDGRITGINATVKIDSNTDKTDYPVFQIWRSYTDSYTNVGEVQLQESQVSQCNSHDYCNVNIVLTGNDTIEFQSGDVVGYYHPELTRYQLTTIQTPEYVQYRFDVSSSSAPTSVNLNDADGDDNQRQPLIQFVIGKRCKVHT